MQMAEDHIAWWDTPRPPLCMFAATAGTWGAQKGWARIQDGLRRPGMLHSHPVDPVGRFGHLGWAGTTGPATKALVPI